VKGKQWREGGRKTGISEWATSAGARNWGASSNTGLCSSPAVQMCL